MYIRLNAVISVRTERYPQGTTGSDEFLYIDHHILKKSKTSWKNVDIERIDQRKYYDMEPQNWIIEYTKIKKNISDNAINVIENRKIELTA